MFNTVSKVGSIAAGYSRGSPLTVDAAVPAAVRFPVNGAEVGVVLLGITGGRLVEYEDCA